MNGERAPDSGAMRSLIYSQQPPTSKRNITKSIFFVNKNLESSRTGSIQMRTCPYEYSLFLREPLK
jgi:hypothetical protein